MKDKPAKEWPTYENIGVDNEDTWNCAAICKAIRLHAEVLEECTDKICRALWAGVKKESKEE